MVKLIEGKTRLDVWMDAAQYLLEQRTMLNLILSIRFPDIGRTNKVIDEFLRREDQFPMHTVAGTIFPGSEYRQRGLDGVLNFYPNEVYPSIAKHRSITWGTYAFRLVRRSNAMGRTVNPLKQVIDKMRAERCNGGPKKSCYEIGVAEGEYDVPLYSPVRDGTRRMGGPCLSHLSFKLLDGAVHLTAFYRSHDYRHKVPGNLLGLAQLQACVAQETGQRIGGMVVHSSYAYLRSAKGPMQELLQQLRRTDVHQKANNIVAQ